MKPLEYWIYNNSKSGEPRVWQARATRVHLPLVSGLGRESGASRYDSPVARNCAKNRRRNPHPPVRLRHPRRTKHFQKVQRG